MVRRLFVPIFAIAFIGSTFATQIQLIYAGGKSPFESGYDHGLISMR
jgi:hypothetical protein